jgi:UDP-N-acetylmuramyl pentapeptide phosphotransferase/UDP-N-acetylglucosamine-1-phosphate transferase
LGGVSRVLVGLALGAGLCLAVTPAIIVGAYRIGLLDRPERYKAHRSATPLLGGTAVMLAFLPVALVLGGGLGRYAPIVVGVIMLWALGTLDDWRPVKPITRVAVEAGLAFWLWESGLGWSITGIDAVDVGLTIFWVVGAVNSFNLFDNLDGAAASMAAAAGLGIAAVGLMDENELIGVSGAALFGACVAFLRFNLARPAARIFLGDGGSMSIGFVVAALLMAALGSSEHASSVLVAGMLVGVPMLDTALVIVSRIRRRISVLDGGRDHLTHRVLGRLATPRRVAVTLFGLQTVISTVALVSMERGSADVIWAAVAYAGLSFAAIVLLEFVPWSIQAPRQLPQPATPAHERGAASRGR